MISVIKRITLPAIGKTFEVGEEYEGQVIIEIKYASIEYDDHIHSEYHVLDEDGNLIAVIENCAVLVEFQKVNEGGDDR